MAFKEKTIINIEQEFSVSSNSNDMVRTSLWSMGIEAFLEPKVHSEVFVPDESRKLTANDLVLELKLKMA